MNRSTWARLYVALAVAALGWVLVARITSPSDSWDQSQPTTIGYTIDMLANGNWVLPSTREGDLATKPPLYNWLAAPVVAIAGYASEFAHKLPSVVALLSCFAAVVLVGRRMIPGGTVSGAGWLAALAFTCNYSVFKIGYLARPDMLLVLWLFVGWAAATTLIARADESFPLRRWLAPIFWTCVGLAAMTKGPAAFPLLFYAVVAPRLIAGRWGATRVLRWGWGAPLALAGIGAWLFAVWRIAPRHLVDGLWMYEIVGRVTGLGPSQREPIALITKAPNMVLYFLSRFEPWCVFAILAMGRLWGRDAAGTPRRWRSLGARGAALYGAAIFVLVMIATYTLVAAKRADYLAPAYAPGALLAAWWLLDGPSWRRWLPVAGAPLVLTGLTIHNAVEPAAPFRGFGEMIGGFVTDADTHIAADPAPVVCWVTGYTHMESMLGYTGKTDWHAVQAAAEAGGPFWLLIGRWDTMAAPQRLEHWGIDVNVTEVARSPYVPWNTQWPMEVVLYRAVSAK